MKNERGDGEWYKYTVTFERARFDDLEVARAKYPKDSPKLALRKQFRDELQEAFDAGYISGHFNVTGAVKILGVKHKS